MPHPALVDFLRDELVPTLPDGAWSWGKKTVEIDIVYAKGSHIRIIAVEANDRISLSFARLDADMAASAKFGAGMKKPMMLHNVTMNSWSEFEGVKAEALKKIAESLEALPPG